MKKFTKIIAATTAFAALFALAGCGSSSQSSAKSDAADHGTVRVWFMEGSVNKEARQYLIKEFKKENPKDNLKIEIQQWDGIVPKIQTALASKNESPDLVETGNTQTSTFIDVNAFADLSNMYQTLGGKNLIQSFVKASTENGKIYALPLYAGFRGVFYRKDLFQKAGITVPKTIDEFTNDVIKLQKANPDHTPDFSGTYLAAVDIHGVESYLFANGFNYAEKVNGKWKGMTSTPQSIKALEQAQKLFKEGTIYGQDSQASQKTFERFFNQNKLGTMIAVGNLGVRIDKKLWDSGKVGVFPLPSDTPGKVGLTFAGGSNISLAAHAPHPGLAKKALKIIYSKTFQEMIAKDGWVPGNTSYGKDVKSPFGQYAAKIIEHSKVTPNSPEWGVEFGDTRLSEFYTDVAKGQDVHKLATAFDKELDQKLNK